VIIPTLPNNALLEIRAHEVGRKIAVQRIVTPIPLAHCKNCMDDGVVYVSFLGTGPTKQPVTMAKPSTWVENGWYLIERTSGYPCPCCGIVKPEPTYKPVELF
jgi:hypothetical protein